MAEYIERETAITAIGKPKVTPGGVIFDALKKACQEEVRNLPAADVVEVVRCRDCEYWMPDGENVMVCTGPMAYCNTDREWYCASAKRKGEDNG